MSSEYSFCSEGGFDELSSSSDSGFDVSFESPKHEVPADALFPPVKEEKRKKTRNTRCKSPTQVCESTSTFPYLIRLYSYTNVNNKKVITCKIQFFKSLLNNKSLKVYSFKID